ncbi:MAG: hypothetical protein G01um101448_1202 [Parcubacteria group bacterium Gr01-1014_48]|nr:MAG: hypothetical protein G01um101448_1202 [Parcubacteria group bacterium Gr01-1014_48]
MSSGFQGFVDLESGAHHESCMQCAISEWLVDDLRDSEFCGSIRKGGVARVLAELNALPAASRDIERLAKSHGFRLPEDTEKFRFYDRLWSVAVVEGESQRLESERFNVSPWHYYGGAYEFAEKVDDVQHIRLKGMIQSRDKRIPDPEGGEQWVHEFNHFPAFPLQPGEVFVPEGTFQTCPLPIPYHMGVIPRWWRSDWPKVPVIDATLDGAFRTLIGFIERWSFERGFQPHEDASAQLMINMLHAARYQGFYQGDLAKESAMDHLKKALQNFGVKIAEPAK